MLVLSDDARGFGMDVQMSVWSQETALIERTYGRRAREKDRKNDKGPRLATCTPAQARRAHLDGVHWPQKRLKYRHASKTHGLIETTSAHGGLAVARAARLGVDAILVSTAFASQSPSAKRPLGAIRLARLQRTFPRAKIYALGGINGVNVRALTRTRIYGVALVSYQIVTEKS